MLGLVLAVATNWVSPRGLSLTRNYFPNTGKTVSNVVTGAVSTVTVTNPAVRAGGEGAWEIVAARLRGKGLHPIDGTEAAQLFQDLKSGRDLVVFVDARDDRHYEEGHIPGAHQFDRYYPEKHLPGVLTACLSATKIVVYCTGGNCEDSEFAALMLRDAGVAPERLLVYAGGIVEWTAKLLPVEVGGQNSGRMRGANP